MRVLSYWPDAHKCIVCSLKIAVILMPHGLVMGCMEIYSTMWAFFGVYGDILMPHGLVMGCMEIYSCHVGLLWGVWRYTHATWAWYGVYGDILMPHGLVVGCMEIHSYHVGLLWCVWRYAHTMWACYGVYLHILMPRGLAIGWMLMCSCHVVGDAYWSSVAIKVITICDQPCSNSFQVQPSSSCSPYDGKSRQIRDILQSILMASLLAQISHTDNFRHNGLTTNRASLSSDGLW